MTVIARRGFVTSIVALLATAALAAPAAAEVRTVNDNRPIELASAGTEFAQTNIGDFEGPITDVDLSLSNIDMATLGGLHVLLVSPDGESEVAMSFNCTDSNVANRSFTFDEQAAAEMPSWVAGTCPAGTYKPSDAYPDGPSPFEGLPGGPGYGSSFANFEKENANGTWTLWVRRTCSTPCADTDQIGSWRLRVETGPSVLELPAGPVTAGAAAPFPLTQTVAGESGLITDLNVDTLGIYHSYSDDIDMMLQGPGGQTVMLMSDACGSFSAHQPTWGWDDEARDPLPDEAPAANGCEEHYPQRPTDYQPGESLPAPAPPGPYSTSLADFDLTDPNGEWRLWVADDHTFNEGFFISGFTLRYKTRPRAYVAFGAAALEITEGESGELTLTRSGATSYATGSIEVTTVAGSATSGSDYEPVSQTLEFAPGQTEKTLPIEVRGDSASEPTETFTVTLSSPTGDAKLGDPASATVTIPSDAASSDKTFGTDTLVTLGLAKKRIPGKGPVAVRIRNANAFAVSGQVLGRSVKRFGPAAEKKRVPLKAKPFTVGPGAGKTVALKLPKKLRRHLRKKGKVALRITASVLDTAGNPRVVRRRLTPKHKKPIDTTRRAR